MSPNEDRLGEPDEFDLMTSKYNEKKSSTVRPISNQPEERSTSS